MMTTSSSNAESFGLPHIPNPSSGKLAGAGLRQFRPAMYDQQTPNGQLMFDGRYTTEPGVARTGNPFSGQATQLIESNGLATLRWTRTLNLCLRYEFDTPYRFVYNDAHVWSPQQGKFLIPGKDIERQYNPGRDNFSTRLGFAYSLTPKTVIRGGAGVIFGFIRGLELQNAQANPPFLVNSSVNSAALTYTLLPGVLNPDYRELTPSANVFSANPDYRTNHTYEQNFTVRRDRGSSISLQTAYVGSASHKLIGRSLINQARLDVNPTAPTPIQNRRPFSGVQDISITDSIDNQYVPRKVCYGPTPYSQPQRFTLSTTYELPFGKGKPFAGSANSVTEKIIGGWSVSFIGIFFKGEYLTPTSNVSANVRRVDRNVPSCVANPNLSGDARTIQRWFNTTAIVGQPFGTFGNCGTGIIQVPGTNNIDMAVLKNIPFGDSGKRLQFRAEAFNTFNHPSFGQPGLTLGSAAFGVISTTRTTMRNLQMGSKFYW